MMESDLNTGKLIRWDKRLKKKQHVSTIRMDLSWPCTAGDC